MTTFLENVRTSARDQRGSILIPGMAMGMILVMCSLHVLDTTKAILLRSLGQNAADAIALEGAIWHAQGMNIIALINVIMAAIFSILLAVRVVELLLIGAIAILAIAAAVASFFSFGTASTTTTTLMRQLTQALVRAQRFEDRISNPIINTLTFAGDAERTLCAVMPYVSLAHPVTLSNDVPGSGFSGRGVSGLEFGVPFAISLVPAIFEQKFSKFPNVPFFADDNKKGPAIGKDMKIPFFVGTDGKPHKFEGYEVETSFPARMGTLVLPKKLDAFIAKKSASLSRKGKNVVREAVDFTKGLVGSLPVQEEDFFQVCPRASELMVANLMHVLKKPLGLDQAAIESVTAFVAVVVGSLPTLMCTPIKAVGDSITKELEAAVTKKCGDEKTSFESDPANKGKTWDKKKQADCKDRQTNKAAAAKNKPQNSENIKVGRLWGLMAGPQASPFLHVWSVVRVEGPLQLEPANAEGEFRHTCTKPDAAKRSCAENSLWSNGWFAKLVPVRDVRDEMRQKLGDLFAGWFSRALGKAITGLVDSVTKLPFFPKKTSGTSDLSDALNRHLGTLAGPKAANGWWNRRLTGSAASSWIARWEELDLTRYPEYLH
jgi:hypothetical protein